MDKIIILFLGLTFSINLALAETDIVSEIEGSAYLTNETKDIWIKEMKSKMSMYSRNIDPFGLPQVIEKEVIVKKPQKAQRIEKNMDFQNAVKALKINAVMATAQKFVIGAREFKEGNNFLIERKGNVFRAKVIAVKSSRISFQNTETKELAHKNLIDLPSGMKKGVDMNDIEGIQSSGAQSATPLKVE